jgi:Ca-activated chloride channel family protein
MMAHLTTILAFMFLLLPLPAVQQKTRQDQEPTISLASYFVLLNVTATGSDNRYAARLTEKEFTILEDGKVQELAHFGAEDTPFAAAILLDVSGSMEQMIRIGRAAARSFAQGIRDGDMFALYAFATKFGQVQEFGSYPEIEPEVWGIKAEGNTALYDCLVKAAEDLGKREEKRRAILLLSDGADTASRASLDDATKAALDAGVTVYAVDLMDESYSRRSEALGAKNALRALAEKTGGQYITDPGGQRMYEAFRQIVEELGHQYTMGYYPAEYRRDGRWHSIEVRISRPGVTVRTRRGYQSPKG